MSDMKLLQFLPAACLATTLLLAACTQDDLSSPTGGVEEASPLHFAASIGPATRATTDNVWNGETVYVQIVDNYTSGTPQWDNSTQQTYTVTVGGVMTKIEGTDAYWQANGEVKAIRAWYDADNSSATTLSDDHSVKTDQSGDGYTQSDFLFAQRIAEFTELREKDIDMTFYHQVAKVKVNILKGDETPAGLSVTGLTIGGIATSGTFTAPALGGTMTTPLGTWSVTEQNQSITPHAGTATGDNTLAAYEALVIPQTVSGNTRLFTIAATGYSDFVYTPTEAIEWQSGMEYTYNITIKGSELEVSTSQRIGWTEGSTGSGSVTFIDITPSDENQTLELKNGDVVNINGGETPTAGRFILNISPGNTATINLNNINMQQEVSPLAPTNYAFTIDGGGSLVFRLNGENTIDGFTAGISCPLAVAGSTAADISIIGPGTLNIKGSNVYAGIVTGSVTGSNKNITIEDATLNLDYHFQGGVDAGAGAAIGSGPNQICGDITITRSDISIKVESSVSDSQDFWYGAAIGSGINGKCGNINITLKEGQDKDTFLGKISVEHTIYGAALADEQKVGAGLYSLGCGTVTWYDSNGNKIE